ncbi:ABC transporter permease [Luteitalea sp.]|uniref:ABC transporter permease n=1 Tax=Luteitalea sp. TaxID=2004800 RepID=UPI0037CCB8FB
MSRPGAAASISLWRAAARIFDLSLDQMLWSRRTVFMALVVGGPLVIALLVRLIDLLGVREGGVQIGGTVVSSPAIFGLMVWVFYLRFAVPVLAVFYGTSLMADEVEDKTITYLFSRPIPRGAVLLGKYLAYLVCTIAVVLPSVVLVYLLIMSRAGASLAGGFLDLVKDLVVIALGLATYGALFAWIGARFKRPLLTGLAFVFAWEPAILVIPGYLRRFTVAYYLQGLVPQAMPTDDSTVSLLTSLFREFPAVGTSLFWLAVITVVALTLAMRTVARREYVLEQ